MIYKEVNEQEQIEGGFQAFNFFGIAQLSCCEMSEMWNVRLLWKTAILMGHEKSPAHPLIGIHNFHVNLQEHANF